MKLRLAALALMVLLPWRPAIAGAYGQARVDADVSAPFPNRPAETTPEPRPPAEGLQKGVFLVASERLADPHFKRSVVLLLEHDATGALGLIINHPSDVTLESALPEVEGVGNRTDVLYVGGPVGRDQLFLLVRAPSRPEGADPVVDDVYMSASLDTLRSLLMNEGAEFHAHVGYAGWGPGQLDGEVGRGDWYVAPADAVTIFEHSPGDVWPAMIKKNAGIWVWRFPVRTGAPLSARLPAAPVCRAYPAVRCIPGRTGIAGLRGQSSSRDSVSSSSSPANDSRKSN